MLELLRQLLSSRQFTIGCSAFYWRKNLKGTLGLIRLIIAHRPSALTEMGNREIDREMSHILPTRCSKRQSFPNTIKKKVRHKKN